MASQYERLNAHDEDELEAPNRRPARLDRQPVPNSPPPPFHSHASSVRSHEPRVVNPDLADAFDESDGDEADDRQRLVQQNSMLATSAGVLSNAPTQAATQPLAPIPGSAATPFRVYGSGILSDGVFSNMTAKPERTDGEKDEQPPTYEQAAADAAPPYWETTILAPGLSGLDEVYIQGIPVGSVFSFLWNGVISMSFQLVGFLLTYLLHSTHAAKNGSRAGLGITLIQYGFYLKGSSYGNASADTMANIAVGDGYASPPDPNAHDFDPNVIGQKQSGASGGGTAYMATSDWVAYILMVVGWFILIRAVSDFLKARRHEQLVLQSPDRGLAIPIIAAGERAETAV